MTESYRRLFELKGKKALIIGGAGYLGAEISDTLAALGADVVIASRNQTNCQALCETIQKRYPGASAEALALDLADKKSIRRCFKQMSARGGFDILVNNAGAGKKNSLESISDEDWDYDIEMNLSAVFRCVKAALPDLKKKKGVVLNVASMYGYLAPDPRLYEGNSFTNPPSYGVAKAGVIQFTKYLASFLSPHGIRVNCISPGAFPHEQVQKDKTFVRRLCSFEISAAAFVSFK